MECVMVVSRVACVAGVLLTMTEAGRTADLAAPPPIEFVAAGWYLRGDIGMSNQQLKGIHNIQMDTATNLRWLDSGGFDSAPFFGIGVGYQYNWLRIDLTGEYRGKAGFRALDTHVVGGANQTNEYTATKSEVLVLANVYADLGTWWHVTPFIGAGIGVTRNQIDHYRDNNAIANGGGWADTGVKWNFAWAAHAGLAYQVTPAFTVELAYRYLSLGSAVTADTINLDGTNSILNNPTSFNNITSHDLKFGARWLMAPAYPPPLMFRG
jgi:opacity protein-like surface antigen